MSSKYKPKVSIIIPTYNRSNFVSKAIESALEQTYQNIEIIISDNHSTDDTEKVCKKFLKDPRVKYFKNSENLGMALNWKKALEEYSSGEYAIILSDDDYFINSKFLEKTFNKNNTEKNITLILGNTKIVDTKGFLVKKKDRHLNEGFIVINGKKVFKDYLKYKIYLCSTIFNRVHAINLNCFTNNLISAADTELFLKLCLIGNVKVSNVYFSAYTIHPKSITSEMNYDFILNNLDYVYNVYNYAKNKKIIPKYQLHTWKYKTLFKEIDKLSSKIFLESNNNREYFSKNKILLNHKNVPFIYRLSILNLLRIMFFCLGKKKYLYVRNIYLKHVLKYTKKGLKSYDINRNNKR